MSGNITLTSDLTRSGFWFMAANAMINITQNFGTTLAYTGGYCVKCLLNTSFFAQKTEQPKRLIKFIIGPSGTLLLNAFVTGATGAIGLLLSTGSPLLNQACILFAAGNTMQSILFGNLSTYLNKSDNLQRIIRTAAEISLVLGMERLMELAHTPDAILYGTTCTGMLFALMRGMGKKLPDYYEQSGQAGQKIAAIIGKLQSPNVAYTDLLISATVIMGSAFADHQYLLGTSRILVIAGLVLLARQTAETMNHQSLFSYNGLRDATRAIKKIICCHRPSCP